MEAVIGLPGKSAKFLGAPPNRSLKPTEPPEDESSTKSAISSEMKITVAMVLTAVVVNLRYYRRGLAPNR